MKHATATRHHAVALDFDQTHQRQGFLRFDYLNQVCFGLRPAPRTFQTASSENRPRSANHHNGAPWLADQKAIAVVINFDFPLTSNDDTRSPIFLCVLVKIFCTLVKSPDTSSTNDTRPPPATLKTCQAKPRNILTFLITIAHFKFCSLPTVRPPYSSCRPIP